MDESIDEVLLFVKTKDRAWAYYFHYALGELAQMAREALIKNHPNVVEDFRIKTTKEILNI